MRLIRVGVFAMGAALAVGLAVGCTGGGIFRPSGDRLTLGTWGGEDAALIAADSVTHIHIGCRSGDVLGRIGLDSGGRFTVDGSFILLVSPIVAGPRFPAQFSGRVSGHTLTFAIAVNDTIAKKVVSLGPVTVRLGVEPKMAVCPVCRVPRIPVALSAGFRHPR